MVIYRGSGGRSPEEGSARVGPGARPAAGASGRKERRGECSLRLPLRRAVLAWRAYPKHGLSSLRPRLQTPPRWGSELRAGAVGARRPLPRDTLFPSPQFTALSRATHALSAPARAPSLRNPDVQGVIHFPGEGGSRTSQSAKFLLSKREREGRAKQFWRLESPRSKCWQRRTWFLCFRDGALSVASSEGRSTVSHMARGRRTQTHPRALLIVELIHQPRHFSLGLNLQHSYIGD
ncbi:PREDICTED: uncharacterized protein LOC106149229 [Chinchilla lanigera]|uniref:uncharacterized protein LOC106149229 n=1 Tax=Chinchilla lanigera TaxID=34839 RepID=UPI000697635B|nr:PREDICTED: uncharacterized protein LOC106149229 [Chinchilla lanigera]